MKIEVRRGNVDKALRIFKKQTKDKLLDYKKHEYYLKPSERKHKAKKAAKVREAKRAKL